MLHLEEDTDPNKQNNGGVVHEEWHEGDIVLISESDKIYRADFIHQSLQAKKLISNTTRFAFPLLGLGSREFSLVG